MAEEIWSLLGHTTSIYGATWPSYDAFMIVDDEVIIAIQVNGKLRATKEFLNGVAAEEVIATASSLPEVSKWIEGKTVVREIFIPNKLLNIVVKE
jgi:leucyl-tRNA synthetase